MTLIFVYQDWLVSRSYDLCMTVRTYWAISQRKVLRLYGHNVWVRACVTVVTVYNRFITVCTRRGENRTSLTNSLLCPFECPYLWRNYRTKLRTSTINTSFLSKLFWNKYVRKNTFRTEEQYTRGNASVPRGTAHYLCTYHLTFVRTINRNQSEPDRTVLILIHSHARIEQFSIRMKIKANHSGNFRFEWKSIQLIISVRII